MPIRFNCPSCDSTINAPDAAAGKRGKCPKCEAAVSIPPGEAGQPTRAADKIKLRCAGCDHPLSVPASMAGRQGKCPRCQTMVQIPFAVEEPFDGLVPIPDPPATEASGSPFGNLPSDPFGADIQNDPFGGTTPLGPATNPLGVKPGAMPRANPYAAPQFGSTQYGSAPKGSPRTQAAGRVMAPAIGMIVISALSLLGYLGYGLFAIFGGGMEPPPNMDEAAATGYRIGFIIGAAIPTVIQVVVLAGAIQMLRLKSYAGAMTAAVFAILPCSMFFILNTPFGIWAAVVLSSANVKRAFR